MATNNNTNRVPAPKEMGHYTEAPGGGKPLPKGSKAPSKQWVKDNRQMQPRDEDGQFTYNAANFHDREYDYHGKANTDMPWMKGNPNFVTKKGDGVILSGKVYKISQGMTLSQFSDMYKKYNKWTDNEKVVNATLEAKKGRQSALAKQQIAAGNQGVVVNPGKGKKATQFEGLNNYQKRRVRQPKGTPGYAQPKQQQGQSQDAQGAQPQPQTPPSFLGPNSNTQTQTKPQPFNTVDAKNNPKKFMADNYEALQEISDIAKQKGYNNIDIDGLVDNIGAGKYKSFDEIKQMIQGL